MCYSYAVIFAAFCPFCNLLQMWEFFLNYANFLVIISRFFSMTVNYSGQVTHLPSYPLKTGRFSVSQMSRMKLASILPWRWKTRRSQSFSNVILKQLIILVYYYIYYNIYNNKIIIFLNSTYNLSITTAVTNSSLFTLKNLPVISG